MTTTKWIGSISTTASVAGNWDNGLPTSVKDAVFDGTAVANCNINGYPGVGFEAKSVNFTGFTRTFLGGDQGMFIWGNVTLAATATYTGKPALYIKPSSGDATLVSNGVHIKVLASRAEPRAFIIHLGDDCFLDGQTDFREGTTLDFGTRTLTVVPQIAGQYFEITANNCHVTWSAGAKLIFNSSLSSPYPSYDTPPSINVWHLESAPIILPPTELHGSGDTMILGGVDTAGPVFQSLTVTSGRLIVGLGDPGNRVILQTVGDLTVSGGEFWFFTPDPGMNEDLQHAGMPYMVVVGGNSSISVNMNGTEAGGTTLAVTGTNTAHNATVTQINSTITPLDASDNCIDGLGNSNASFVAPAPPSSGPRSRCRSSEDGKLRIATVDYHKEQASKHRKVAVE